MANTKTVNVPIRGNHYPVIQAGNGVPCLLICLGTPSFRTLSKNFFNHFEVYSSDMYWITENALEQPDSLTIDTIIDDIKALGEALNLKKYFIFGHSAYGIIALEFAKKYPNICAGIIMVGTPVNSNATVAERNNLIFQQQADVERKKIDAERRGIVANEDLSNLTSSERWSREYIYRDAPRYWHIPEYDCSAIWSGVNIDPLLFRLFSDILPNIDVLKGLEKVKEPVFLASGVSDYDCCPWEWQNVTNLPPNFTMATFNNSGHWPHFEEPDLFDQEVIAWSKEISDLT